jgi:F-type H+-transporting ATPase subunit gamma
MAGGVERILRGRIRSMQATKKITRAMELIAASRIVKAQQRVASAVPYSEQITDVVKDLAAAGGSTDSPLLKGRDQVRTVAYVVISADRGLCGGYNVGVQRAAEGEIKADVLAGRDYRIVASGRKAESYFRFRNYTIDAAFAGYSENPAYANAKEIGQHVIDLYASGHVDRVMLVYTRFISAGSQEVVLRPLVPLDRETVLGGDGKGVDAAGVASDYEYEPDPITILDTLLPRYVEARIYAALLNAAASEHAFRQRAMKSATDNADELIKNLSIVMNRARQDSITTEIMEIVGGAEALGSGGKKDVRMVDDSGFAPLTDNTTDGLGDVRPVAALAATAVGTLEPDDLEDILGIGPVINGKLKEMGITTFAQVAAWTAADAARIGEQLDFPGRIERENWIEQARTMHANKYGN